jgi:long-chain acyl-CoA synthetase
VPPGLGPAVHSWEGLQDQGRAMEDLRPLVRGWSRERRPEDLLTLIYTSGTTGEPKGAMLTHGNLAANIASSLEILPIRGGWRCLSFLPLSHIFERMAGHYTMAKAGVSIYYVEDLAGLPQALLEVRPQILIAVPRVFEKIYAKVREQVAGGGLAVRMIFHWAMSVGARVAERRYLARRPGPLLALQYRLADFLVFRKVRARLGGRVEMAASGGAPLGARLMEFFWAAGVPVYEGYGLSETSPVLAVSRPGEVRPGSVGRPILDTWKGRPFLKLAPDGEILCQGPSVTRGYWNDPVATAQSFDEEGYFRTGDIGALDPQGRLCITDRKKELLVTSGGKNVAPQPIEKLLTGDKYIAQAVVIGDGRHYLTAVVFPNLDNLRRWAQRKGLGGLEDAELMDRPETAAKIMARVERINEHLSNYERVRKVVLAKEEMTLESGLLTPSLKVKRRAVNEKYGHLIEALYQASA